MLAKYKKHNNSLYNKLVEFSRNIFFYSDLKLKDNFETRIILIFVHLSLILISTKLKTKDKFPQHIFDNIFLNIEYHIRELGYGDVVVNKKMKTLNKIFYDILLKINDGIEPSFKANKMLLNKYLSDDNSLDKEMLDNIDKYLQNFYNFCFELSNDSVLKGNINFKY
tara:strand:+ start:30 stop:530 length:501 start_codon:yes stop_codon:yes gene_type:complete